MNCKKDLKDTHFTLHNERLRVDVAIPGAIYKGSRFDWTGFIIQVLLDDKHTFCVPESSEEGQGTGGNGICNEFGIASPIGYNEAKPGEKFPKIGVGLLTRIDESPYSFGKAYAVEPFPININVEGSSIEFVSEPIECNGYAFRLKKNISLFESYMKIDYQLDNTGSKAISTDEYCHNFIGINSLLIDENYRLKFSENLKMNKASETVIMDSNEVRWIGSQKKPYYCSTSELPEGHGFVWELVNNCSKVGISEECGFSISKIALWGSKHVVSPECFISISINPGETKIWSRKYSFFYT